MKILFYIMALSLFVVQGCSKRDWYEVIQSNSREQCRKLPPSQYDACIERHRETYDDYEQKRKGSQAEPG